MNDSYNAVVIANVCDVRFAFSGKVVSVNKKIGDAIAQWERIASLDTKMLQTELDLELSDYEKVRAEFEIFNLKNGQGGDDVVKFLRTEKQASLNASVKQVELSKMKMDQAVLLSPVAGFVMDMGGLVPGIYITPASATVKIADMTTLHIHCDIPQKDLPMLEKFTSAVAEFPGFSKKYTGTVAPVVFGKDGIFSCTMKLDDSVGLLPGMVGKVILSR